MQESDCQTLVDNESLSVPDLKEMEISTNSNVVSESRVELAEDESQRQVLICYPSSFLVSNVFL